MYDNDMVGFRQGLRSKCDLIQFNDLVVFIWSERIDELIIESLTFSKKISNL